MGYPKCLASVIDEQANLKAWQILLQDLCSLLGLGYNKLKNEFFNEVVEQFISSRLQPKTEVLVETLHSDDVQHRTRARETLSYLDNAERRNLVVIKHRKVHRP